MHHRRRTSPRFWVTRAHTRAYRPASSGCRGAKSPARVGGRRPSRVRASEKFPRVNSYRPRAAVILDLSLRGGGRRVGVGVG